MRNLDADLYRINYSAISGFIKDKSSAERVKALGELAIMTSIPIIIVACYVGEIYGFDDLLNDFIARTMVFYDIEEVLNVIRK